MPYHGWIECMRCNHRVALEGDYPHLSAWCDRCQLSMVGSSEYNSFIEDNFESITEVNSDKQRNAKPDVSPIVQKVQRKTNLHRSNRK